MLRRFTLTASVLLVFACRTPQSAQLAAAEAPVATPGIATMGDDGFAAMKAAQAANAAACVEAIRGATALVEGKQAIAWSEPLAAKAKDAFRVCLGHYVRLQTINPPGDELKAVAFLDAVVEALGIPRKVYRTEERWNLVATLSWTGESYATSYDWAGAPAKPGVGLYHHTDVVNVHPEQWRDAAQTFSGNVAPHPDAPQGEEFLWGRGSIDMKSYGVLQLLTMALRHAAAVPATHDLHWIAAADEEVGAKGARGLLKEMAPGGSLQALAKMDVILNEGGFGLNRQGKDVFVIASEEKGGAWLELSHADPRVLVQQLHLAMNLTQPASAWKKKQDLGAKCAWTAYDTPGSQVNVVPSIGELVLDCAAGATTAQALQQAFSASLAANSGVSIDVAAEADAFRVKIRLASSGHGSLGGLSALQVAAAGLSRIGVLKLDPLYPKKADFYKYQRTPGIDAFVRTMGKLYYIPGVVSDLTQYVSFLDQKFLKAFGNAAYSEALFRTTCSWTSLSFKKGEAAKALADCRLVHTGTVSPEPFDHGAYFVEEVKKRVTDPAFVVRLVQGWNFGGSSLETADFKILTQSLAKVYPAARITAFLAPTSSDSTWFRAPASAGSSLAPIRSYGFFPAILASELTATIHGSDERLPMAQAAPATRIYVDAVGGLVAR